jgi:hypothetical protein
MTMQSRIQIAEMTFLRIIRYDTLAAATATVAAKASLRKAA